MTNLFRRAARPLLAVFAPIAIIATNRVSRNHCLCATLSGDYRCRDLPESAAYVPDDFGSLCRAVPTGEFRYGGTNSSPYIKASSYPADESMSFVSIPASASTAVAVRVTKIFGGNFPAIAQMSVRPTKKAIQLKKHQTRRHGGGRDIGEIKKFGESIRGHIDEVRGFQRTQPNGPTA